MSYLDLRQGLVWHVLTSFEILLVGQEDAHPKSMNSTARFRSMTAFLMLIIVKWWGERWSSALPLRRSRKNLRYSTHNAHRNGFSFHSVSGVVRVQRHGSRLSRQPEQHVNYPRIAFDQSTFPGCDPRAWSTLLRI